MNRLPFRLALFVLMLGGSCTRLLDDNRQAADLEIIARQGERRVEALKAGDAETFASFYAEDALMLPANRMISEGRERIREYMAITLKQYPVEEASFTVLDSGMRGDLYYEAGRFSYRMRPDPDAPPVVTSGRYVTVHERQADGSWKIKIDMGSRGR